MKHSLREIFQCYDFFVQVLDDYPLMARNMKLFGPSNFVRTDPKKGLTRALANSIITQINSAKDAFAGMKYNPELIRTSSGKQNKN